jgi:hypothetical protein
MHDFLEKFKTCLPESSDINTLNGEVYLRTLTGPIRLLSKLDTCVRDPVYLQRVPPIAGNKSHTCIQRSERIDAQYQQTDALTVTVVADTVMVTAEAIKLTREQTGHQAANHQSGG